MAWSVAFALAAVAGGPGPAVADPAQATVVSENPLDYTPHMLDGTVWAMAAVGETVAVGGSSTSAPTAPAGTCTCGGTSSPSACLRDGSIRAFAPAAPFAVGGAAWVGLARLDADSGAVDTGFDALLSAPRPHRDDLTARDQVVPMGDRPHRRRVQGAHPPDDNTTRARRRRMVVATRPRETRASPEPRRPTAECRLWCTPDQKVGD